MFIHSAKLFLFCFFAFGGKQLMCTVGNETDVQIKLYGNQQLIAVSVPKQHKARGVSAVFLVTLRKNMAGGNDWWWSHSRNKSNFHFLMETSS